MSIRFGSAEDQGNWMDVVRRVTQDDRLLFKVAVCILNSDKKVAYQLLRRKFNCGGMACLKIVHEVEKTYTKEQLKGIVKFIEEHNPEYAI